MAIEYIANHDNSEGERISIAKVDRGKFVGKLLLVIHDDPQNSSTVAPMLLDEGTVAWLKSQIDLIVGG